MSKKILAALLTSALLISILPAAVFAAPKDPKDPKPAEEVEINYHMKGHGGSDYSVTVTKGETVELPTPTDDDYEFAGWYTDPKAEKDPVAGTSITPDKKKTDLHARWTEKPKYTVTFNMSGVGTVVPAPQTVKKGDLAEQPTDPYEEDMIFLGWYADDAYSEEYDFTAPVESDITVYARWKIVEYTVVFNMNGHGSQVPEQQVEKGDCVQVPDDPAEIGYVFGGWYTDEACTEAWDPEGAPTANMQLYALWSPERVDISVTKVWEGDEGIAGVRPENIQVQLLANGEPTNYVVTLGQNCDSGWGTEISVNVYTADGQKIIYTVKELNVDDNYKCTVTGTAEDGFTIINEYVPKTDPGKDPSDKPTRKPTGGSKTNTTAKTTYKAPYTADMGGAQWMLLLILAAAVLLAAETRRRHI